MGRKPMSYEEFLEKFYKQNKNANNIEILGEYINGRAKIKCKCKIDGYEWKVIPSDLLYKNCGCPKCNGMYKTTEEFKQEMKEINDDIEILGEYKSALTKIKCKCKIDGHEWEATPHDLLSGRGCPKCYGRNKTTEEFVNELKEINDNIEILGEYIKSNIKIKCKCKIDGYEWEVTPNSLLNGSGCPKCVIKSIVEKRTKTHKEFINEIFNMS